MNFVLNTEEDSTREEEKATEFLNFCDQNGLYHLGSRVGKQLFFEKSFRDFRFLERLSIVCFYGEEVEFASDVMLILLSHSLEKSVAERIVANLCCSIPRIKNRYLEYPQDVVKLICERKKVMRKIRTVLSPVYTFSITTCKRLDLFKKTMNSFLQCCTDLLLFDEWICVDDNSDEEDRKEMKRLYPFFKFYWKKPAEKGHARSMNLILNLTRETTYLFHMEDDWQFFLRRNYLTSLTTILASDVSLGQVLINRNYAETETEGDLQGGIYVDKVFRYYVHEHTRNSQELEKFISKYGNIRSSSYWPHYSLRPSLLRREILTKIGEYDEKSVHFERNYADRYLQANYLSAFMEGMSCYHIGRLTSEIGGEKLNAYDLNSESQFGMKPKTLSVEKEILRKEESEKKEEESSGKKKEENSEKKKEEEESSEKKKEEEESSEKKKATFEKPLKGVKFLRKLQTYVVNLDRRKDRYETFLKENEREITQLVSQTSPLVRFSAVDGSQLKMTARLARLLDNNDFSARRGMVGCALSHISIWNKIAENESHDIFLILEDDVKLSTNFIQKLNAASKLALESNKASLLFIGHSLHGGDSTFKNGSYKDESLLLNVEVWKRNEARSRSLGGTFGYIITKAGAIDLLNFVNAYGITNGIDWVMLKAIEEEPEKYHVKTCYCTPHLVFTEAYRGNNNPDSDIQYAYDCLDINLNRVKLEKEWIENNFDTKVCEYPLTALNRETIIGRRSDNHTTPFVYFVGKELAVFSYDVKINGYLRNKNDKINMRDFICYYE